MGGLKVRQSGDLLEAMPVPTFDDLKNHTKQFFAVLNLNCRRKKAQPKVVSSN
ncbi:hypothetical protein FMO003_24340 [Moritella sp. F3]|nr:hypothetical protein FMO001_17610 [Moritella sp. F1]GIC82153.1 hypothetical protein FMO003_24340 [Moritella sp. F3]